MAEYCLEKFIKLRPFLFHLTAVSNLERIKRLAQLESAALLMSQAGCKRYLRVRRQECVELPEIGNDIVTLRDQKPLKLGKLCFENGWSEGDFIQSINSRVFFWPGSDDSSPIPHGKRHFDAYVEERPVILQVPTKDMFDVNPKAVVEYCRVNSGSAPLYGRGLRGPNTFLNFKDFVRSGLRGGAIKEVTFVKSVKLPPSTLFWRLGNKTKALLFRK